MQYVDVDIYWLILVSLAQALAAGQIRELDGFCLYEESYRSFWALSPGSSNSQFTTPSGGIHSQWCYHVYVKSLFSLNRSVSIPVT